MKNMTMITAKEANNQYMDYVRTLTKDQHHKLLSDKATRDSKKFEEEKAKSVELEAKIAQLKKEKEQREEELDEKIRQRNQEDMKIAHDCLLDIEGLIREAIPVGDWEIVYPFYMNNNTKWNRILQTIINELTAKGYIALVPLQEHNQYFEIVEPNIHQLHVKW